MQSIIEEQKQKHNLSPSYIMRETTADSPEFGHFCNLENSNLLHTEGICSHQSTTLTPLTTRRRKQSLLG